MATPFKLKSGNASAFKNMGSSPAKQVEGNFNKTGSSASTTPGYNTTKTAKAKNLKKNFDAFQSQKQKGKEFVKNLKTNARVKPLTKVKKPTSTLSRVTKALGTTPSQLARQAKKYVKPGLKVAKQISKRFLGPLGVAATAYDVIKTLPKAAKATNKSLKKEAKTGSFVGKPKY